MRKSKKIKYVCNNCGKEFMRCKSRDKGGKYHFCSKKCFYEYYRGDKTFRYNGGPSVKYSCDWCGKKMNLYPRELKAYENHFCSIKCHAKWKKKNTRGEKASGWKGGISKKEYICEWCGKKFIGRNQKQCKHRFCSQECFGKWKSENIVKEKVGGYKGGVTRPNLICDWCDKEYIGHYESLKVKNHFCSRECHAKWRSKHRKGKDAPGWKGGPPIHFIICSYCGKEFEMSHSTFYAKERLNSKNSFCSRACQGKWMSEHMKGENSPRWQGGITPLRDRLNKSLEYREWRDGVLKKDDYTCQDCFKRGGHHLHAHHDKKSLAELRKEAEKHFPSLCSFDACILYDPMWEVDNGTVLCKKCHVKRHSKIKEGV